MDTSSYDDVQYEMMCLHLIPDIFLSFSYLTPLQMWYKNLDCGQFVIGLSKIQHQTSEWTQNMLHISVKICFRVDFYTLWYVQFFPYLTSESNNNQQSSKVNKRRHIYSAVPLPTPEDDWIWSSQKPHYISSSLSPSLGWRSHVLGVRLFLYTDRQLRAQGRWRPWCCGGGEGDWTETHAIIIKEWA